MKKLLIVLMMLAASVAGAQSDCQADYCGSVPIMGAFDDEAWNTDVFVRTIGDGTYYLRFRAVPGGPYTPPAFFEIQISGTAVFGAYDLVRMLWGGVEYDGVILLDWASYDTPLELEILPLLRKDHVLAGKSQAYLVERGCHIIPAPWSGGSTAASIEVYNPSETSNQTAQFNGGEVLVVPASPLDDLNFITIEVDDEYGGAYNTLCIGVDHPGSSAGFDLEQPVWVLPRFFHAGDRIVTRVW